MEKVKNFLNNHKGATAIIGSGVATVGSVVPAFAEGETVSGNITSGMTTAIQTGLSNVQADVITLISTALPYALVIMGLGLAISIGMKVFKRIAGR